MGRRGPAPKPTVLKVLEGNPGKRALPKNEPQPIRGAPACPSWLTPEAKREWRRVVPELDRLGLLSKVDGAALATYCTSYGEYVWATKTLAAEGRILTLEDGRLEKHPAQGIQERAARLIKLFCAEFGLTPSARSRMTVPGQQEDDSLGGLLD